MERGKIDASARQCSEWKRRNEVLVQANEPEKESDAWGCLGVGAWVLGCLSAWTMGNT